ncbi:hypothetical protein Drorol1_Dr00021697 [Drosera rotundifolia]
MLCYASAALQFSPCSSHISRLQLSISFSKICLKVKSSRSQGFLQLLTSLRQSIEEERAEWEKISASLKAEYLKHTPLLAKILDALVTRNNVEDKVQHYEQIIDAANEVVDSIDTEELANMLQI